MIILLLRRPIINNGVAYDKYKLKIVRNFNQPLKKDRFNILCFILSAIYIKYVNLCIICIEIITIISKNYLTSISISMLLSSFIFDWIFLSATTFALLLSVLASAISKWLYNFISILLSTFGIMPKIIYFFCSFGIYFLECKCWYKIIIFFVYGTYYLG